MRSRARQAGDELIDSDYARAVRYNRTIADAVQTGAIMVTDNMRQTSVNWPDIDVSKWAETKRGLHLYAQMLGKVKLVLAPLRPNWIFAALYLTPRGITTGTIPWRGSSLDIELDVFKGRIVVSRSNGVCAVVPLLPVRTVAEVYHDLTKALEKIGVPCTITPIPQEVPDTTPLPEDQTPCPYDADAAVRWFHAATVAWDVFDEWRSGFFGRAGLQLWWGAFDLSLMLFSGRKVQAPTDRGYLMKYDLDAELLNVGLYFGDQQNAPFFYGYIHPEPKGSESLQVAPEQASWSTTFREWVLPYDIVRASPAPAATLTAFLDSIYDVCVTNAGWNRDDYTYVAPKPPRFC